MVSKFLESSYVLALLLQLAYISSTLYDLRGGLSVGLSFNSGDDESQLDSNVIEELSCPFNEKKRRIWAFSPRDASLKAFRRYGLPARFLMSVRSNDVIILPGGHIPTKEYVEFATSVIGIKENQLVWTNDSHYRLDDDIGDEIKRKLMDIVSASIDSWVIIPYGPSNSFRKWSESLTSSLDVSVLAETQQWIARFGNKGMLHRHMSNLSQPSVIEEIDPTIPVPKGYFCRNSQELTDAYILLNTTDVVIKPVSGSSGEGIEFVSSIEEIKDYSFPMNDVVLEEKMPLDVSHDGVVISPAVHYMGPTLLGNELVDQIMEKTAWMGWRESVVSKAFSDEVFSITRRVLEYTKPQGPGGYDFLSVGGQPVLVDINTGRFNGAHQPKIFLQMHAPNSRWYCWKHTPAENATVANLWRRLQRAGIAFYPNVSSEGVFPITHLRGIVGLYIAVANTTERAMELYRLAQTLLLEEDMQPWNTTTTSDMDVDDDEGGVQTRQNDQCDIESSRSAGKEARSARSWLGRMHGWLRKNLIL